MLLQLNWSSVFIEKLWNTYRCIKRWTSACSGLFKHLSRTKLCKEINTFTLGTFPSYFHIYFQLSINKPFPEEKLPGKGNLNWHHSHQFDARASNSCCTEPGKGLEVRNNEPEAQHKRIQATAASTSASLRAPLKYLHASTQVWTKHKRSWRCAHACEGYDPIGTPGK